MTHRWEHEDEYLTLKSAFRRAQQDGDTTRCDQLRPRIDVLDGMMWQAKVAQFPELKSYRSVVEALQGMAAHLDVPFPDLTDPHTRTGDSQFIFAVSDGKRTVQIWPMQSRGYYDIEVFDYMRHPDGDCYKGQTTLLEQATIVLSRWFVERCTIRELHAQCPWMADEPFQLNGPRLTME
jgi:hypothetical protein